MAAKSSLRARHQRATRDTLASTALALFRERGFDVVTADLIAERAQVSRRTFFRYFPNKEDSVFAGYADRLARFRALLRERPPGESAFGAVRRSLLAIGEEYVANRRELVSFQQLIESSPTLVARELALDYGWQDAIADRLSDGSRVAAERRRARLLAGAILGLSRASLREWFANGGRGDLVAIGAEALDLVSAAAVRGTNGKRGR